MKLNTRKSAKPESQSARFSATVDPSVLAESKDIARVCGFRHSFSAYVNEALRSSNQQRTQLLGATAAH